MAPVLVSTRRPRCRMSRRRGLRATPRTPTGTRRIRPRLSTSRRCCGAFALHPRGSSHARRAWRRRTRTARASRPLAPQHSPRRAWGYITRPCTGRCSLSRSRRTNAASARTCSGHSSRRLNISAGSSIVLGIRSVEGIETPTLMTRLIMDPYLASYGVENPIYAVLQLAQTTMRSELGKIALDKTFEERDALNEKIVSAINEAATDWGLKCIRYEISDITPPTGIKQAMEMQAEAERRKRAQILESEGKKQAQILESEGKKTAQILESEGAMLDVANRAKGEAEAILAKSEATARGMTLVSEAMQAEGSAKAASLKLAEQYIEAFSNLAQKTNTMLLPGDSASPASFVAQAMKTYQQIHSHSQALKSHPQIEELEESVETCTAAPSSEAPPLIEEEDSNQTFTLQRPKNKK